jgi:hypothetical protein
MSHIGIYSDLLPEFFGVRLWLHLYRKKAGSGSLFGADSGSEKNAAQHSKPKNAK